MDKRTLKDLLYEHVARIGKAVSSPKRLEILELLAQGEKTVDTLTSELSIDIKLTSAHLKALKEAQPKLMEILGMMDDLKNYHAPEKLPNGDIILRRKTPAELKLEALPGAETEL